MHGELSGHRQWGGAFNAEVRITNTGPAGMNGWTLGWAFAGTQQITNLWNGAYTQTGTAVVVTDLGYNATIGGNGGSQLFGFQATWSNANANPTCSPLTIGLVLSGDRRWKRDGNGGDRRYRLAGRI